MTEQRYQHPEIPAFILAGGSGQRMGGRDKCLLPLGNHSVLAHIIERLRPQCGELYLNANGDAQRFNKYGLTVIPDQAEPPIGPLGGLRSALDTLSKAQSPARWMLSVAGDSPFLPCNLVSTLLAAAEPNTEVIFCRSGGRDHFVIALWSRSIEHTLDAFIATGRKSVCAFIQTLSHCAVTFEKNAQLDIDPFFNINTQEQWQRAAALIGKL